MKTSTLKNSDKNRFVRSLAPIAVNLRTMKSIIPALILLGISNTVIAQEANQQVRQKPKWLWGLSVASNFNFFNPNLQVINPQFTTPSPIERGFGIGSYGSGMIEYRHSDLWGIMYDIGFDQRGGILHYNSSSVSTADLNAQLNYVSMQPSFRISPWKSPLYFFIGPSINFNVRKHYSFTEVGNGSITNTGNVGYLNDPIISGQVGAGYDFPLSSMVNPHYIELSPFVVFTPYWDRNQMRNVENLTVNTLRAGVAIKFGYICFPVVAQVLPERKVEFNVQVPSCIRMQRMIKETLPLRNFVFFDKGSDQIPARYKQLSKADAGGFKEDQMQSTQSADTAARSSRQLSVYYNILNVLGDRLRNNPTASITLVGSSGGEGEDKGKVLADNLKNYLVNVFGIDASRIATVGRDRPFVSSKAANTTQQFDLVDAEDRRVDILSSSPEIEMPYGDKTGMLKPAFLSYQNPDLFDMYVFFNAPGAKEGLNLWNITLTDNKGKEKHFGPFTGEQVSLSGKKLLGDNESGTYKVLITGVTKRGDIVQHESTINLVCKSEPVPPVNRYSILFEFDKSKTTETYHNFLTNVVAPAIKNNSTVIIHGHTDIVGPDAYNMDLSKQRAEEARVILQDALNSSGKGAVSFQTYWFGEDVSRAPFGNDLPEERFYNRTVIIDIIPSEQGSK